MSIGTTLQSLALLAVGMVLCGPAQAKEGSRHLGPTGIYGVINKRDVLVTKVVKGSPADGKVKPGDVILGVGGAALKGDVRKAFADAIDQAETKEKGGTLTLTLKRVAMPTLKSAGNPAEAKQTVNLQLDEKTTRMLDELASIMLNPKENMFEQARQAGIKAGS